MASVTSPFPSGLRLALKPRMPSLSIFGAEEEGPARVGDAISQEGIDSVVDGFLAQAHRHGRPGGNRVAQRQSLFEVDLDEDD